MDWMCIYGLVLKVGRGTWMGSGSRVGKRTKAIGERNVYTQSCVSTIPNGIHLLCRFVTHLLMIDCSSAKLTIVCCFCTPYAKLYVGKLSCSSSGQEHTTTGATEALYGTARRRGG